MPAALRYVIAVVAGVVIAFATILGIERIGHRLYPFPAGVDVNDPAALGAWVASLPPAALAFPLAGWLLGSFAGGLAAAWIAAARPALFAGIIGAVVLLGAAANFALIPHPAWIMIAAAVGVPSAAWLAGRLGRRGANRS